MLQLSCRLQEARPLALQYSSSLIGLGSGDSLVLGSCQFYSSWPEVSETSGLFLRACQLSGTLQVTRGPAASRLSFLYSSVLCQPQLCSLFLSAILPVSALDGFLIFQFPLVTMTSFQLLLLKRWLLMLFSHYWCHCCVCCTWPVLWSCPYRQISFCHSESWLLLCLPFCCLAATAALLSLLLLPSDTSSAPQLKYTRPPKKLLLVPNFPMAEELSLSQVTKLLAYIAKKWVFSPTIANLAFRWRFVLQQLHQCLFSTCHNSPTRKKNAPSAFVGNGLQGHQVFTEACNTKKTGTNCFKQPWLRLYLQEPEQSALVLTHFFSKYPWSVGNSWCSLKSSLAGCLSLPSAVKEARKNSIIGLHCPIP